MKLKAATALLCALIPVLAPGAFCSWSGTDLGNSASPMRGLAFGYGRNDAKNALYAASADGRLYEFRFASGAWQKTSVAGGTGSMESIGIGFGRNDSLYRLYGKNANGYLYEFSWSGQTWATKATNTGNSNEPALAIAVGPGRDDGNVRLYNAAWDSWSGNLAAEFSWDGSNYANTYNWGSGFYALHIGNGRNDGKSRLYKVGADSKLYENTWTGSAFSEIAVSASALFSQVTTGFGRNPAVSSLYAGGTDGYLYEFAWAGSAFSQVSGYSGSGSAIKSIALGDARNAGTNKVYTGNAAGEIYEFNWTGSAWAAVKISTFPAAVTGISIGDGRNNGRNALYASCADNHVYELSYYWPPPSDFSGTALSTASIKWTWKDNVTDEDGYRVKSSTNGIMSSQLPPDTTEYAEAGLLSNNAYTRYVYCANQSDSGQSGSAAVYTLAGVPGQPGPSNEGSSNLSISWTGDGTRYKIERAADNAGSPDAWAAIKNWAGGITSLNYADTGLQPNTTYWYRITAYNGDMVEGTPSQPSAWQTGPGIPSTPTDSGVWLAATSVVFDWTAGQAAGADKYHVQVGEFPNGNAVLDTEVSVAVTSVTVTGQDGHSYYCRVRAGNSGGKYGAWTPGSDGIGVDVTPPGATIITSPTHPFATGYYAVNAPVFTLLNPDYSGAGHYYALDQVQYATPTVSSDFSASQTLNFGSLADGTWYFHALPRDQAGNLGLMPTHFRFNIKTAITPAAAGIYSFPDGSDVQIPAGAVAAATSLVISTGTTLPSSAIRSPYLRVMQKIWDITLGTPGLVLLKPISLVLHYQDNDVLGMDESGLKIAWWDENKSIWQVIRNSVVYPADNRITAEVDHLTRFSIVVPQGISGALIDSAYNYPNPFNPGAGTTIRYILAGAAKEVKIKIFALHGQLIRELPGSCYINMNEVFWDGKDRSGNPVNSEVFLAVVEATGASGAKSKKTIKMAAWRTK